MVPWEQRGISPQCGFSSTGLCNKLTIQDEVAKLRLIVEVAEDTWGELRGQPVQARSNGQLCP